MQVCIKNGMFKRAGGQIWAKDHKYFTSSFWGRYVLRGWDTNILGESPEFEFYKPKRFYPDGHQEWLPLQREIWKHEWLD